MNFSLSPPPNEMIQQFDLTNKVTTRDYLYVSNSIRFRNANTIQAKKDKPTESTTRDFGQRSDTPERHQQRNLL